MPENRFNEKRDTIIVRCSHCGTEIGHVSYVPGTQIIGCKQCNKRTSVQVFDTGFVNISVIW